MYKIKKIYYDNISGERIWDVEYNQPTTIDFDHDYRVVSDLNVRKKDSIELLILENGAYTQDFTESNSYRINPKTKELEFTYPDPNEPDVPQEFNKPLTAQIEELKQDNISIRLETAQSNAELFEMMIIMSGGSQ